MRREAPDSLRRFECKEEEERRREEGQVEKEGSREGPAGDGG